MSTHTPPSRRKTLAVYNMTAGLTCLAFLCLTWVASIYTTGMILYVMFLVFALACGFQLLVLYYATAQGFARQSLLATGAWILVAALAGSVIVNKLYNPFWSGFTYDAVMGWKPLPDLKNFPMTGNGTDYLVTTNNLGYRERDAHPATVDYLVQGDSNIFGYGLAENQTLPELLKTRIKNATFYNAGVSGFDVNNYYFQYAQLARQLRISKRIIMFNIGNDFSASALKTPYFLMRPYLEVDASGHLSEVMTHPRLPGQVYGNVFIDKYAAYNKALANPLRYSWGNLYPDWLPAPKLAVLLIEKFLALPYIKQIVLSPGEDLFYPDWLLLRKEHWPAPFPQYADDFERMLKALHDQNPQTIICLYPMRQQVLSAESEATRKTLLRQGWKEEDIDLLAVNRYLRDACAKYGLAFLDTTPFFSHDAQALFQGTDQHLSPQGMALVADALRDFLARDQ